MGNAMRKWFHFAKPYCSRTKDLAPPSRFVTRSILESGADAKNSGHRFWLEARQRLPQANQTKRQSLSRETPSVALCFTRIQYCMGAAPTLLLVRLLQLNGREVPLSLRSPPQ